MSTRDPIEIVEPTPEEVEASRRGREQLARALEASGGRVPAGALADVALPEAAVRALARVLEELSEGHAVAVHAAEEDELTLEQAAEILGVSVPFLVDHLDGGGLPVRWEGHRRRFRLSDVLAYKRRVNPAALEPPVPSNEERLRGLEEMAEFTDGLGLGY